MSVLSVKHSKVADYLRAVPRQRREGKLFNLVELMNMKDYPDSSLITPFYVQSVSLVDFMVQLKGGKTFVDFLREAPRRGWDECLKRYYGIKDRDELQQLWIRAAGGPDR
jgi:hypothetical protein